MNSSQILFSGLLDQRRESMLRTTFTLTEEALDALHWLQNELNVQARDIADITLCQNEQSQAGYEKSTCVKEILALVQEENDESRNAYTQRKNLSLRKVSVQSLNELVRHYDISRDVFVNHMILHARKCLEKGMEERNQARKQLADDMHKWLKDADHILEKVRETLPESDPCREMAESIVDNAQSRFNELCSSYL